MRLRGTASARWQHVPDGTRDLVPAEAERLATLDGGLKDEFRRWGYRQVATPTLEFLDTILRGAGPGIQDELFKIVDAGGELLALRPEMTVPIARLAATRLLRDGPRPLRLAYVARVFRGQEAGRGRLREFTQAGVELLGEGTLDGDAEVIALAAQCLLRADVPGAVVSVGHLGFVNDVLARLPAEERADVRGRLYRREFAGIESAVGDASIARLLAALPDLHGADAIERARPLAETPARRAALDDLEALLARLSDYGVRSSIVVDLSIIRDLSYYTGVVFEAYSPAAGLPLLGGGRYDGLLARFGAECAATGFALGLERVLTASPAASTGDGLLLVGRDDQRGEVTRRAAALRQAGVAVTVGIGIQPADAVGAARRFGLSRAAWIEEGHLRVWDVDGGEQFLDVHRRQAATWSH